MIFDKIYNIYRNSMDHNFLIDNCRYLKINDIFDNHYDRILKQISPGDVVALIGDFTINNITLLLKLIELNTIIVPLTNDTKTMHQYFFDAAFVNVIIKDNYVFHASKKIKNNLIDILRECDHAGLVLFTSGTTGQPKAILHDFTQFLKRYDSPKKSFRTLSFLLFDHIGGLNTFFYTLYNKGVIVVPRNRNIFTILQMCTDFNVELLPTTPTFLRLMLISGLIPEKFPKCCKLITYGTEIMDQNTLFELTTLLKDVDFRQTYGMSELGIFSVKSKSRDSLFIKIDGEDVNTKIINKVLYIKSKYQMLGYLNAPTPFDESGWYNTKDIVERDGDYIKIIGRTSDIINVGGLKFLSSEVENVAMNYPGIEMVKVFPRNNPITGQHAEIKIQIIENIKFDKNEFRLFLLEHLPAHMVPRRIYIDNIKINHRFKKA